MAVRPSEEQRRHRLRQVTWRARGSSEAMTQEILGMWLLHTDAKMSHEEVRKVMS